MSAPTRSRRRGHRAGGHDNDERWLLTYADMITLLMALFMVLFSISSVNISKYKTLQRALKDAFSGHILSGGKAIRESAAQSASHPLSSTPPAPTLVPLASALRAQTEQARREQQSFAALKRRLDAYARTHGFAHDVQTTITRRGLVVRLLTDRVLFESGQARLRAPVLPLLGEIGQLLSLDHTHSVLVEGHTDDVPIHGGFFPSNWELSTARATTVVRFLLSRGLDGHRVGAAGYAAEHPLASNATARGRARNRRVEIVLPRQAPLPTTAR